MNENEKSSEFCSFEFLAFLTFFSSWGRGEVIKCTHSIIKLYIKTKNTFYLNIVECVLFRGTTLAITLAIMHSSAGKLVHIVAESSHITYMYNMK